MPKFYPQKPVIVFGDGAQARAIKVIPDQLGEDGQMETEIHMEPTLEMKRYHELEDKFRNIRGWVEARYLQKQVTELNSDPIINTIFVDCDFNYGDTPFTKEYPDKQTMKMYMQENRILKAIVAKLEEDKQIMLQRLDDEMKKDVLIVQTARKAGRDLFESGYVPTTQYAPPGTTND